MIPLTIIPLWDPAAAADEIRRNASRGARAVCFSELPSNLGLPSIHDADRYWHPFLQACDETGTVVCMHIGSGSKMPSTSPDAPPAVSSSMNHQNAEASLLDWLFSGVLVEYENLKVTYSEGQIGWIPYVLARADRVWDHNRGYAALGSFRALGRPSPGIQVRVAASNPRMLDLAATDADGVLLNFVGPE
jgi:predicted TIM-barrel fold metal-dependent hydrolase